MYVIGDDFEGYTVGAGWEDLKLGLGNFTKWTRIAVVTDHDGIRRTIGLFAWMFPGEVKVFPLAEQPDAITWAGA